ncbi:hypothetical protein FA13DRAFT_171567 [Coprinellus micaceus]|uniref:Uncharacterized protein n=1 Tax=Coprinellus micaceus TaxID=71717 RepID=A0A4Y7SGP7_COPMI|nr:hypothetical protein FA13DRAFT_171567 [Coprinellus micaceus]
MSSRASGLMVSTLPMDDKAIWTHSRILLLASSSDFIFMGPVHSFAYTCAHAVVCFGFLPILSVRMLRLVGH